MAQSISAFELHQKVRAPLGGWLARTHDDFAAASFEAHPDPQFVIDGSGGMLAANAAGRRLLAGSDGAWALVGRSPESAVPELRGLRDRIQEVIRTQHASPESEVSLAPASRFAVRVCPLGPGFRAALLIARPRASRAALSARERFGFTNAETLVAERLARGLTVPQIALQLGISIETVRCHLKQAFAKAGVHRQAQLVAVMLG